MSVGRELLLGAGTSYLLNDYTAKENDALPQQPLAATGLSGRGGGSRAGPAPVRDDVIDDPAFYESPAGNRTCSEFLGWRSHPLIFSAPSSLSPESCRWGQYDRCPIRTEHATATHSTSLG